VSRQASERHRIVVGVDGSAAAEAALRWAADEAPRRAARLEAVIAWRPTAAIAPPAGHPSASTRTLQERREDAEEILEAALRAIEPLPVEIERRVMRGTPHRVLLDVARDADLLVIGGHSRRLSGKLPWSTGQHVVHEAKCPVVVVPAVATGSSGPRAGQAAGSAARAGADAAAGMAGNGTLPG
jgi:nucleotide-binding universal stress UspA family protein